MSAQEWRALIAAYVEGRLGADAFKRRYLEAFEAAARRRGTLPGAVQRLYFVVEAYAGDPTGRGADIADDADLAAAAREALSALDLAEPPPAQPEPEPAVLVFSTADAHAGASGGRARRVLWRAGAFGGVGCFGLLLWFGLGVAQFFAIAAQIDSVLGWGPAPSTLLAFPLAFTPVLGGIIAFFGAKDVWGWAWPLAAIAFLAAPLIAALGGWRAVRRR